MKTRILKVSNLSAIQNESWVDKTRRVYCVGDTAYVPVKDGEDYDEIIPERCPGPNLSYQKMGDTLILHGINPTPDELKNLRAWEKPSCILLQDGF